MLKYVVILLLLVILPIGILGTEVLIARTGPRLVFRNPPSTPRVLSGQGTSLTYAVMGDSTAAGEGASSYASGIADTTANYLAKDHAVTYLNVAVSGSVAEDILKNQVGKVIPYKPDVVLLSVGANDVVRLTMGRRVHTSLEKIISQLIAANCNVKIVLTGSPDMGSIPRFPQPLREIAGLRTKRLNTVFTNAVAMHNLTFAPIAEKTGPAFRAHPELFAIDHFHPTDKGYALWFPVLENALDDALAHQPTHCIQVK